MYTTPDKIVCGGTVRVEFYPKVVVRTPLSDTDSIIKEEARTSRLLQGDPGIGIHCPRVVGVNDRSIIVERISGRKLLDYDGSSGQETYFIELQMIDYVSKLHRLGVCLSDLPDVESNTETVLIKADRFLVDGSRLLGGRMVDTDGNGMTSILLAQKVRGYVEGVEDGLKALEEQLKFKEVVDKSPVLRGLKWISEPIREVNEKRFRERVLDYEKFKSFGGFLKINLGITPIDLNSRAEALADLDELSRFQSNCKIAVSSLEGKHPLIRKLAAQVELFNDINFRKSIKQAISGGNVGEEIAAYQQQKLEIDNLTKEILMRVEVAGTNVNNFAGNVAAELTQIYENYKCSDNNLSRRIELAIKNIGSGKTSIETINEIRSLKSIKDDQALETILRDWNTLAVINCEMRRRNKLISDAQANEFIRFWKEEMGAITTIFAKSDLVNPEKRRELVEFIKSKYAALIFKYDVVH